MECLSSSQSVLGNTDEESNDAGNFEIPYRILKPSPRDSSNWLSCDVAFQLESLGKLDLALPYFSKLMREHPSWPDTIIGSAGASTCSKEYNIHQHDKLLQNFQHKLYIGLAQLEQRCSLVPAHIIGMVCCLWIMIFYLFINISGIYFPLTDLFFLNSFNRC